jgi:hypothetical protein
LLALSDDVQKFSVEFAGLRTCHGCGKKAASLQKCSKCSFFWYCDKVGRIDVSLFLVGMLAQIANMICNKRPVKPLVGRRKATRLIAKS